MASYNCNGLRIEAETFGNPKDPCILLIMGLGMQLTAWYEGFCNLLVNQGFYVVRFDNRDIGLSTGFEATGTPFLPFAFFQKLVGLTPKAAYNLSDMAKDSVALLDQLGIAKAHVVGASMGGMIAQTIAIEHPERVLSLTSIMSTTGARNLPQPTREAKRALLTPIPKGATPKTPEGRKLLIDQYVQTFSVIGSKKYQPKTEAEKQGLRERLEKTILRSYRPTGVARQITAILASPDRTAPLKKISAPTLVLHGEIDPLIPVGCAMATAELVQGSKLEIIEDMGHDLPEALWPRITGAIVAHAKGLRAAA